MTEKRGYDIRTDVRYGPLELVDAAALVSDCDHPWFNQTLCAVNESVIRLGIVKGEFHWHRHDRDDEAFFVLEGLLLLDLEGEGETVELGPHQGFVVPRGVLHRTRAPERTVMLMMARAGVTPEGDDDPWCPESEVLT